MRLAFTTPINFKSGAMYNKTQRKPFVEYRFNVPTETLMTIIDAELEIPSHPRLLDVLKVVGSHATLWIGTCRGIVAPMDVQPIGWTWDLDGEKPVPAELFWQWTPDKDSALRMTEEANHFSNNPDSVFGTAGVFKQLVPFNFSLNYEKVEDIEGITIQRLADLVRKDVDWVFEFENAIALA
jgi:hypothetical protein